MSIFQLFLWELYMVESDIIEEIRRWANIEHVKLVRQTGSI